MNPEADKNTGWKADFDGQRADIIRKQADDLVATSRVLRFLALIGYGIGIVLFFAKDLLGSSGGFIVSLSLASGCLTAWLICIFLAQLLFIRAELIDRK